MTERAQAEVGVPTTQADLGVRATQAGLGVRATQADLGVRATQAGRDARARQAGRLIWLVMRREIIERVRARSFLISTLIYLVVAMATVIVPNLVGDRETVYRVGLTGAPTADLERAIDRLAEAGELDVRTLRLPDAGAAATAVRDERVNVAVVDGSRLLVREEVPERLGLLVNTAAFQVQLSGRLAQAG